MLLRNGVLTVGNSTQIEFKVKIGNSLGIHARPASMIVQLASQFVSDIAIEKDGEEVNGKSLMGVLMLSAGKGSELKIIIEGHDAEDARDAFVDLVINRKFDED